RSVSQPLGLFSEKLCAFCYSGEKSFLGQGDLMVFGPTPGYVPCKAPQLRLEYLFIGLQNWALRKSGQKKPSPDSGLHSSSAPGSTDPFSEEPAPKFWDELGQIGLPDDINVQSLFDPTGQCCAHLHCAAWSEGVCRGEAQDSLLYVDKAIDSGSTECCAYCKRLGASIKCCEEGCCRSYHFPCAAAAGTFQDLRRHTLLCPDHLQLASQTSKEEVKCLLCDSAGDLQDQLFCTTCGQHYHGACLDVGVTPLKRAGWQCPECKVCLTCRNPGEDSKMLVCDMCDKGYHTFCLQPAMESIPTNGWRCKNCRVCSQCGVRQAGHWGHNITLCESCHTRPEEPAPALLCPLCGRGQGPSDVSMDDLLNCHTCKRYASFCRRGYCAEPAQEIQVTVTLTEGPESPQRSGTLVGVSPLACQSPAAPRAVDDQQELEISDSPEAAKRAAPEEALPHNAGETKSEDSKTTFTPPTKEISHEPLEEITEEPPVEEEKPMEVVPVEMTPSDLEQAVEEKVLEPMQEEQGAVAEKEVVQKLQKELEGEDLPPIVLDEGEVLSSNVLPVEEDTIREKELSPMAELPQRKSTVDMDTMVQPYPGYSASVLPTNTTFIPLTPKIGMGKPAISKRKFSPGRPRVKQVRLFICLLLSLGPYRKGRGSTFPGRRRPRGANLSGRGGRGRSRGLKAYTSFAVTPGVRALDMCVACGSFGQGSEGRLLACSQCGQCYHPFCVNIKITRVVLSKGWRCLECTVCEACGQASDPGRLLLCDDCDISYHTYCLDPPLQTVPKGSWKCKWCVSCTQCGATSPGLRCDWQNHYTLCGPCGSLASCPVCMRSYREDELIVQCRQCDRWVHACCQGLNTDEEVENAADDGFDCTMCRMHTLPSQALLSDGCEAPMVTQMVTKTREPANQKTYTQDGVCLTESGMCQLQSLVVPSSSTRRGQNRRPKPKLKLKIINQNSVAVLQSPLDPRYLELSRDGYMDNNREGDLMMYCDVKSESSPEREPVDDDAKGAEDTDGNKKRKRKPYRPGIGGFMVRQRSRTGQGIAKRSLSRKASTWSLPENPMCKEEGKDNGIVPKVQIPPIWDSTQNQSLNPVRSGVPECYFEVVTSCRQQDMWMYFWNYFSDIVSMLSVAGNHGMFPRMPMMNGMMGPNPHFPPTPMMPGSTGPCGLGNFSPIHRMPFPDKISSDPGPVPGPVPPPEGETDTMSNAQRSTLKWEKEETLGEMATVAPVLYTNVNFPNLLEEFPDWAMRVKQIAKLWRKASSQDRAPYVQKARDNRAALRINKVQMSNDTLKRHQHPQQQQPLLTDTFDPNSVPLDTEMLFKDSLKPKESEHEQEWKFRQQMRQKSKQQAKIEATQKLEQVKNEQLQQQQQQQQQQQLFSSQSGGDTTPNSGNQSPMTPQPSNGGKSGNSSPLQPIASKDGFARPQLPSTPTSGSQDDVFLRPQLPPPSSRTPTQETSYPQQGPSSQPQFSPGCSSGSRPSSPWDPYAKMVGTPRPPHGGGGSTTPRQNSLSEMQERGGRPSPAHESFVLPTSGNADPYAKMPDTPRPPDPFVKPMGPARVGPSGLVEQQQHQQVRHNMMSPPSGGETFARMGGHRDEVYQRMSHNRMILSDPYSRPLLTPIPGSNESGSVPVFKAPMPPQQSQQEPYGGPMPGGLKRGPSDGFPQGLQADPYAQQPLTPRPPMGEGFPNEPKMMRQTQEGHFSQPLPMIRHPHRNLYAQAPSTPRPDYSQQMSDPYAQPPGTPRPHSDSYAQPPGTPRPHSDPSYLQTPPNLRTPRPAPGDRFPKSPGSQRNMDPYAQQPGTPRPLLTDPYAQAPGTSRPEAGPDVFNRLCSRPTPMSQVPADPFSHQSPGRVQDGFACPSAQGSQTAKHPGMSDESFSLPQSNHHGGQTQIHDPFELGPMTPYAQTSERQAHDIPQSSSNTVDTQNSMLPHLGDTEEKLRQRQRLRQQILRQQQQKSAIQQEKGLLQDTVAAPSPGTPRHWSHEDYAPQNDMFGRPPPPYPGPMRGGQRFPGTFLGDQRGHFPRDMGNMGMRPQEMRFGFPPSAQGSLQPGQEQHFLRPLHQMPGGPIVDNVPPQMRMSHSVDFSRGVMGGNTQMGLPQPFPPQGLPVQQHNIMGQPFIELRHRAPQNRMRMPFGHGPPNVMDPSNQPQIPPQGFMEGQEMGFAGNQGSRMMDPIMDRPSQGSVGHTHTSASMENLHQQQTEVPMTMGQRQHPSLNRSLSHPVTGEPLNAAPSSMLLPGSSTGQTEETPIPSGDGIEENMDAEDSAVKDLEDVEVKDLVDLNLNLDPDDGKDLELGPNDLHLDDFLMSGKFDLIAYTDPELNLDDKKDMFSEEDLDLGDPMEDHQHGETSDLQKALSEKRKGSMDGAATSSRSGGKSDKREAIEAKETLDMFKTEDTIKTEVKDEHVQNQDQSLCSGPMNDNRTMTNQEGAGLYEQPGQTDSSSTPVLSCLLIKEKLENTGFGPNCSPHQGDMAAQATGLHASTSMLMLPRQHAQDNNRFNPSVAMGHRVSPTLVQSRHSMGNLISGGNHSFGSSANQQVEMNLAMVVAGQQPTAHGLNPQGQQGMFPQQQGPSLGQAGPQNRPLLLEEQPLLLQDLLDQERQEQQQQRQMQAMIRQRSSDSFFPNMDFDAITDPIMKAKMVALKGINKVMSQNSMGMPPISCLSDDSQRKQYEEWLQETQQLLQMQQKFLEDQIGAHRKSKKALSAKQRTAKKAGREFPEEDVEQLKHVTEQQSVVQKQLEQIRKQQKDHAELIEEYRVKQQQQRPSFQAPMMPGMPPMPGMPTQAAPMMPGAPPMGQPMMGPMMPMQPHPGQHNPARIPNMPGWHPGGAQGLMGGPGPRIPAHMPPPMPLASPAQLPPPQLPPPHLAVKFDDNNPFSEGFQERERRDRLREQQERQRVQLMQEVERHRAMQQRLEMEQQGLGLGPTGIPSGPGATNPGGDSLAHMPFYSTDLPQDFMQPSRPQQQQGQLGPMYPEQSNMQPSFTSTGGPLPGQGFMPDGERRSMPGNRAFGSPEMGPNFRSKIPMLQGLNYPPGQPRPAGFRGRGMMPRVGGEGHGPPFGMDSSTPLPPNYPGSGQSLIQLYSNIIPEEKAKKKRNRKKKRDSVDDADSVKTPSTPHSDLCTPLTPSHVSDTSSTPTRSLSIPGEQDLSDLFLPVGSSGLAPSSELERQLSGSSLAQGGLSNMGSENDRASLFDETLQIKLERIETECRGAAAANEGSALLHGPRAGGVVKEEEGLSSPLHGAKGGDAGNELLKHLLKNKSTPPPCASANQTPPTQQMSCNSLSSEQEASAALKTPPYSQLTGSTELLEPSVPAQGKRKQQRNKRTPKNGPEKPPSRYKRRKKEEEERQIGYSSTDSLTQLKQQNNLSNPPTPPASLPPTPPPMARQKMVNGFATAEDLARKATVLGGHDVIKGLGVKQLPTAFRTEEDLMAHAITQGPKTVDVPASLPTPPHNNQEELRGQDHCVDRDTPDSFVPSSSPESVVGMEISRYPDLSKVKEEPTSPCSSPVIPMLPSASGKEVKTEPSSSFFGSQFGQPPSCTKAGLVSIEITLNPVSAEVFFVTNLCKNVFYLVKCSVMLMVSLVCVLGSAARGEGPKPQWCCHCKVVVLGNGVRKSTKDLACSKRVSPRSVVAQLKQVLLLNMNMFINSLLQPNISPLLPESSVKESPSKVLHKYSNNMSTLDVRCLAKLQPKESAPSSPPPISFPTEKPKPDTLKVTVKLKPRPRAVHSASGGGDDMSPRHHKRWKGLRWRKWSVHVVFPTRGSLLSSLPGEDEVDELLRKLGASLRPDPLPRDLRRCCFCHEEGDGMTDGPARLLNLDLDLWVHLNCALWSSEVYETQAGALINVELALRRGMAVRCTYCQQTGATSGCHRLRCGNAYHFTCALKAQCTFFKDKTMLCHLHRPRGIGSGVFRRVYVQRDEARQMASIVQRGERRHTFRVGSLVFHTVGQLLPQQMAAFHSANAIFPVGYRASRIYWSTRHGNHRCRYLCSVEENEGQPEFVVRVIEQGYDDLVLTGASPKGVWDKILEPVADRRNESGTLKLFPVYLKGEDLFGFTVTAVTRIVESLPGVEACDRYTFRFGRNPLMELPLAINPSGSARSEPKACSHVKRLVLRPHTLSSTGIVSSKSMQTIGSVGVVEAPEEVIPKQFASVPFQYRRMKAEWKSNVYLARSRIQGLGLYAARDIESHTMVMEYIGTLIRNEVANRMEKMYESQNRGVYMFRLDSEHVVDATITGGPARYINHSCAPNCIAEAVSLERGDKIVISSCRNIQRGEELCYDYKFDLEDDQHKIPCHCGAVNCRKWMN
uniref:Histone-lysine N-methyltransferase 2C n=1 Tax=Salmo trutta TaxID=8032 RepID=A0A674BEF3_SALTR